MPVSNAITPPMSIAIRMPLPAFAVAAPRDVNSPVPTIIAAVSSSAVTFPRLLVPERGDLDVAVEVVNHSLYAGEAGLLGGTTVRARRLALPGGLVERCLEPAGKIGRTADAPEMEKHDPPPFPPEVSFIFANTLPTAPASFASSPMPPMCMNMIFGESQKKWLWSAVTARPLSRAALMTGLTCSSVKHMSPIIIVWSPALVN